jgi:hypothetical protein
MPWRHILTGGILLLTASLAQGQALAPITDPVEVPLLPTGILEDDVELFGLMVYLWRDDAGAEVVHFVGDFEMHVGQRRLKAREAVIWMGAGRFERRDYHSFEVVLWRDAQVIEPGGTTSSGPILYVTLNSFGKVQVSADKKAFAPSGETTVYSEAARVRASAAAQVAAGPQPAPQVRVIEPGLKARIPATPVRPAVNYEARDLTVERVGDRRVIVAIGNVYLSRSADTSDEFLELRADAAVIYLAGAVESTTQPAASQPASDRPVNLKADGPSDGTGMKSALGDLSGARLTKTPGLDWMPAAGWNRFTSTAISSSPAASG